jgi:hypothetical protein
MIAALTAICRAWGLDPEDAEPVQHAAHAVVRLPRAGVLLRLTPTPSSDPFSVRVAAALTEAGVPTVRLWAAEPAVAEGWSATAWHLLPPPPPGRYPAADLAGPLSALHRSRLPISLPAWDLAGAVEAALHRPIPPDWARQECGMSPGELRERLTGICRGISRELSAVEWTLGPGTVHGDAHTGNLLHDPERGPVLCDLDTIAWGPPEADLAPAAHGVRRFRRDPRDYERLATAYGYDVRDSPGWPALCRLRDLQLAVYLLPSPPPGGEPAHRVRTVLDDDHDAVWHRFAGYA